MTLEHLDIVLAFAAIMAGVSLFITTLTQISSSLLGLRGVNLKWGLQMLIQNIDPALKGHAESLVEEILRHPLISDSMFAKWTSPLLNLPIIRNWKYANAIRIEEFMGILKKLSQGLALPEDVRQSLTAALRDLRMASSSSGGTASPATLQSSANSLEKVAAALPETSPWRLRITEIVTFLRTSPAPAADLQANITDYISILHNLAGKMELADALRRLEDSEQARKSRRLAEIDSMANAVSSTDLKEGIRKMLPRTAAKADRATAEMEQWFNSAMDRASQHFRMHMRFWTVLFSLLVAVFLQLDAIQLLTRLSSDAELRARVVTSADAILQKANEIQTSASNAPAAAYLEAMRELKTIHSNELSRIEQPAGFADFDSAGQWLNSQLAAHNPSVATNAVVIKGWMAEYAQLVPQATLRAAAGNLQTMLHDKLTLQLIPDPYPSTIRDFCRGVREHLWGILSATAFLSLGAPFWFSLLKSLSNLRPIVASKEEKETKAAAQG